jgi:hypothetical protein
MLHRSVRATFRERSQALPGDELISNSIGSLTHAITIRRSPSEVWPWLAQMGAGSRAGWYSYDVLDNGGQRSAERIIPELQIIPTGTVFPARPGERDGFHLLQCEPGRHLVLGWLDSAGSPPIMTWSFVLEERDRGSSRLVVRARARHGYSFFGLPWWLAKGIVPGVHFLMERKQLLGIARRAEGAHVRSAGKRRIGWRHHRAVDGSSASRAL